MIDGQNFFDQPVKNNLITYDSIPKNAIGWGYDHTTECLLDYNCFKDYYKIIAVDLGKSKAFDADAKVIQQINFTGNEYEKNDKIIPKYFQYIALFLASIESLKTLKYTFSKNHKFFLLFAISVKMKMKKYLKKKNQLRY